jgi:hypothetical protein
MPSFTAHYLNPYNKTKPSMPLSWNEIKLRALSFSRKIQPQDPVNIKAAERMALLHHTLKASGYERHDHSCEPDNVQKALLALTSEIDKLLKKTVGSKP